MNKYFVCDRERSFIDLNYAQDFYNKIIKGVIKRKLHDTHESAMKEMRNSFYDDSDYHVMIVIDGKVSFL